MYFVLFPFTLNLLRHFCEFVMSLCGGLYKLLDFFLPAHYIIFLFVLSENKDKNKAEILLLSVAANIVSSHTSMVGVDKDRKEKVVGEMVQRIVPLMPSRGYQSMSYGRRPIMRRYVSCCVQFIM